MTGSLGTGIVLFSLCSCFSKQKLAVHAFHITTAEGMTMALWPCFFLDGDMTRCGQETTLPLPCVGVFPSLSLGENLQRGLSHVFPFNITRRLANQPHIFRASKVILKNPPKSEIWQTLSNPAQKIKGFLGIITHKYPLSRAYLGRISHLWCIGIGVHPTIQNCCVSVSTIKNKD